MKFCVCVVSVVSFRFSNAAHLRRESILGSTVGVPLDAIAQESLAAAQASFDRAARPWATKYEEDLLRELRKAIGTAPTVETDMRITTDRLPTCQPDVDNCPIGWVRRGDRCVSEGMNAGVCSDELLFFTLSASQRLAMARHCRLPLSCQQPEVVSCDLDLSGCPRFWREVKVGVCHAPQFYDGSCPRVLDVRNMSDEAKGSWSTKCGTMWPCQDDAALGCVRDYHSDACPVGWRRSGMDCVAPASYVGCHSIQQFDKFAPSDKREWEQSCGAHFPCSS